MKLFFEAALERGTVATSVKVALFVGSILAMINYGDRILLYGEMRALDWFKLAVTYCVATYGAAGMRLGMRGTRKTTHREILILLSGWEKEEGEITHPALPVSLHPLRKKHVQGKGRKGEPCTLPAGRMSVRA